MRWMRHWTGWIAGATVGVMVLWFVGTAVSTRTAQADTAGWLFGTRVPLEEYLHALDAVTHQAILSHGEKYRQEVPKEELENRAWERLTLLIESKQKKIRVSDQEVIQEIQKWPIFQTKDGSFDRNSYGAIIPYSLGTTPRLFEEEVRGDLVIRKLLDRAFGHIPVTDADLREEFHKQEDTIQVKALLLPHESLAREVADVSRQQPMQLDRVAGQLNLPMTQTDFFKRSTSLPDFGGTGEIFSLAFSRKVGEISGPFSSPKGWIVARVEAQRPADEENIPPLRDQLERQLSNQKKLKAYLSWTTDLHQRANLRKGDPFSSSSASTSKKAQQKAAAPKK